MIIRLRKYGLIAFLFFYSSSLFGQTSFIESIQPRTAASGTIVSIQGQALVDFDRVFFGAVEANVVNSADQLIEVEVPAGATFKNITLLNSTSGETLSGSKFLLSYGGIQGIQASDFDAQINRPAQDGLYDVAVADLDGDGLNDIVGSNSDANSVTFLRNISTPGSITTVTSSTNVGAPTLNVETADLDGDGRQEVLLSEGGNTGERIFILRNQSTPGNFAFTLQTITVTDAYTKRVIAEDLDLDGWPELIISDQEDNRIHIIENTSSVGNLSFSSNIISLEVDNALSTAGLDVEDMNGDGLPDIVTNQFQEGSGGFYISLNRSEPNNISFDSFEQFNSSLALLNLKLVDFNNDDKLDVVATSFINNSVLVFLNTTSSIGGNPTFSNPQNLTVNRRPWGLDIGDVDGDGKEDIIAATIGSDLAVSILNNSGASALSFSLESISVDFINRNIKVGDIDGDSKPDIVFSSVDDDDGGIPASQISILRNNKCIIPEIKPEGPLNVCASNPVRLEVQDVPGLTYEWFQNGTSVKTGSENFIELSTTAESGIYTVIIESDGGTCAEESEAVEVTITSAGALPAASIDPVSPVCVGGTLNLNISADVGASEYRWRGPADFTDTGQSVSVTDFSEEKAGRYFLDVIAGAGCVIQTVEVVVEIIFSPDFFLQQSGSGTYCAGDLATLNLAPNRSGYSYQWYRNNNPISAETASTLSPSGSGDYYVEITDDNNNFCPLLYSDTLSVTFLDEPQAAFNSPANACVNSPITFQNTSIVDSNATADYSWDFGDGTISGTENPNHIYNAAGTYTVSLEVSYDNFATCSAQITEQIIVNEALNFEIQSSSSAICIGGETTLSLAESYQTYNWSTGENSESIVISEPGTYSVTVTDANGCDGTAELQIRSFAEPSVQISAPNNTIIQGDTITITASGLTSYNWSDGNGSLGLTGNEINISPESTSIISVSGVDENGCVGTAEIIINVEQLNISEQITPMKFFSPNNDAIAQRWEIENIEEFLSCGVEIYDQQGNKIFESKPYNNDWEGFSNGSPVPDGVYYFIVRCDESGIVKSGSITLLR